MAGLVISPAAIAAPAAATPPQPQPPADSAISVYVEQIPTATGSVAVGAATGTRWRLSAKEQQSLTKSGGSDAAALEKLATSPGYGPPRPQRVTRGHPTPSPAASTNVPGDNTARLLALALVLVLTTAVVAAARRGAPTNGAMGAPQ